MRKLFLIISSFLIYSSSYANQYEFLFCAKEGSIYKSTSIAIYNYNRETNAYDLIASGSSSTSQIVTGYNGLGYVDGVSGKDIAPTIFPTNRADSLIDNVDTYLIVVENLYAIIHPTAQGFDAQIYYTVTNGVPSLSVSTAATVLIENEAWNSKMISLRNNFGGDKEYVNGIVFLKGEEIQTTGFNYSSRYRQSADFPQTVSGTSGQTLSGNGISYYRIWRKWDGYTNNEISQTLYDPNPYSGTAIYARQCNITIQNDFGSAGSGGTIKYGGNNQSSPYQPSLIYDDENYSVEGISQSASYIDFTFNHWEFESANIGSSNPKTDFKPTSHGTLKAKFTGKPNNGYRNLSFNYSEEGQPVKVTWSKHPLDNSDVTQYAVYRKVTTQGTPTLLTTVTANGSNTYTYTDYDYAISSGDNKILLFYDVRAYYAPSQISADVDFGAVYGVYNTNIISNNFAQIMTVSEIPTQYSFTNYPNPFNPTTTISYQLPEKSYVTIKVFDLLGKEVTTLVSGNKNAGYYSVQFDAGKLTSGIYICTINAGRFTQSKKIMLMK